MSREFLLCSAQGIPILTHGSYDTSDWVNFSKLTASIGGLQDFESFQFYSHGRVFVVKPVLTSFHRFYAVLIEHCLLTTANATSTLVSYFIGRSLDFLLHESMAQILSHLEMRTEQNLNNGTFANCVNSEECNVDDCFTELFPSGCERDHFIQFEEHFIRRALVLNETGESPLVASWFTALKLIPAVKALHLYQYIVKEDGPDSEFISVAAQCKISFQELYADTRRGATWMASSGGSTGGSSIGGEYKNGGSAYYEALVESYLQSYQQGKLCAHVEDAAVEIPLVLSQHTASSSNEGRPERVICLPNGIAVVLTIISEKLVFATVLDIATGFTPSSIPEHDSGIIRSIQPKHSSTIKSIRSTESSSGQALVRTLSALDSEIRSAWEETVQRLMEAFPVYCPQSPPACSLAAFEALFGSKSSMQQYD